MRHDARQRFRALVLSGLFWLSFLTTTLGHLPASFGHSSTGHVLAQVDETSPVDAQQQLQQGIFLYSSEQYAEAIAVWEDALAAFIRNDNPIGQALVLNNLSLAHQQLGDWEAAEQTVQQSLSLLLVSEGLIPAAEFHETMGKVLNTQGELFWAQGQTEQALARWKDAVNQYQQAAHTPGVVIAQINQAKALQSLGLNAQATDLLSDLYQALLQVPDQELKSVGLKSLGQALRRIGELTLAQEVLLRGSQLAPSATVKGEILLELGNTEQDLRQQALATGRAAEAKILIEQGLHHYQEAAQLAASPLLSVQARVNRLSLLIEAGLWADAASYWHSMVPALAELPPSRSAVYAHLNFARSLICLRQPAESPTSSCPENTSPIEPDVTLGAAPPPLETITHSVTTAVNHSRQIQDTLAESFALGQLGQLYALEDQTAEAIALTEQGLELAENLQIPESSFRLYRQLGQLLNQTGDRQAAIAAYEQAVNALELIRGNLLRINSEVLFSFRENAEPIYREFVDLLLAAEPSEASLRKAIRNIDNLQRTELENFLGCDLSQLIEIGEEAIDPTAAKIYPIILPERLAIILDISGQPLQYYETPVPRVQLEKTLQNLRAYLTEPGLTPEAIAEATKVYQWLIQPLEPHLGNNPQIQTLVFVPDGTLRNIPMGVLYDGETYLLEKGYSIAIAPRLELFRPQKSSQQLSILAGGVEIPQLVEGTAFPPIEGVAAELSEIPNQFLATPPLLNEQFTLENIEERLSTGQLSAIHWKTHGVFSSNPQGTFLVTYRNTIDANTLSQLVQNSRLRRGEPLEFMALSACETAQGDDRAVLGLAGLAVRAGVRSTLSTLWRAEDNANTLLMADFYRFLQQGETKAQALQHAQLNLLEGGYTAPYYWATYVLVGNWL